MPQIDFSKPQTFLNTLETFALALNCVMIALRNEAEFNDEGDQSAVEAANALASMLEDARTEAAQLGDRLERRALGMTGE